MMLGWRHRTLPMLSKLKLLLSVEDSIYSFQLFLNSLSLSLCLSHSISYRAIHTQVYMHAYMRARTHTHTHICTHTHTNIFIQQKCDNLLHCVCIQHTMVCQQSTAMADKLFHYQQTSPETIHLAEVS
jgi:hypothetical protein